MRVQIAQHMPSAPPSTAPGSLHCPPGENRERAERPTCSDGLAEMASVLVGRLSRLSCRPHAPSKPRISFPLGRRPTLWLTPYIGDLADPYGHDA